ncbi:brachyurin-like isoform X2 [Frankliniella occidentalis]|uniref:Brachyurin-like isoform X2 n=1 Tax=Frankliniella occidentalis TaxID=133901 RepID=A0A9C6XVH4_FRAOC|nr:brachyurin-like isoform X2 [Frankliniella occidentalis]
MSNMKLLLLPLALSCSLARGYDYQPQTLQPVQPLVPVDPSYTYSEWQAVMADQAPRPEECDGCVPGTEPQPAVAGSSAGARHSVRIIGGQAAAPGQFPWQAQVRMDNSYFCGGSILSAQWILSAGHCASGFSTFVVVLGSVYSGNNPDSNKLVISCRKAIVHEGYNSYLISDDISLISLGTPIRGWNSVISPIRLPSLSDATNTFSGWPSTVSGFGRFGDAQSVSPGISPLLRYVNVVVIDNAQCAQTFGASVRSTNICTSGGSRSAPVSACNGDSGGALVVYQGDVLNKTATQVGIVSFGSGRGCNLSYPSAYTRVTSYLKWISSKSGLAISA